MTAAGSLYFKDNTAGERTRMEYNERGYFAGTVDRNGRWPRRAGRARRRLRRPGTEHGGQTVFRIRVAGVRWSKYAYEPNS